jgi:hypothetical protein
VHPEILDLLWTKFKLEVPFMRHHFDYKEFRDEIGCPGMIRYRLEEEGWDEDLWTFGGRWNPICLPSETSGSILCLSVDSECLSVCCRGGVGKSDIHVWKHWKNNLRNSHSAHPVKSSLSGPTGKTLWG